MNYRIHRNYKCLRSICFAISALVLNVTTAAASPDEIKLIHLDGNGGCIASRIALDFVARNGEESENEIELTDEEATLAWACVAPKHSIAFPDLKELDFLNWKAFSQTPYLSAHGSLVVSGEIERLVYVMNYANPLGKTYGLFDTRKTPLPEGTILAKPSIAIEPDGRIKVGVLSLMTKLPYGSRNETGDWRYQAVWPTKSVSDIRPEKDVDDEKNCVACHLSYANRPKHTLLPPPEYRTAIAFSDIASLKAKFVRPSEIPFPEENPYSVFKKRLGKVLFFDPILSAKNNMSCANCHNPGLGWEDGLPKAIGFNMDVLSRKTPTILNVAWAELLMWDGRFESLEEQAIGPIRAAGEMRQNVNDLIAELSAISGYRTLFSAAFPGEEISMELVGKAGSSPTMPRRS